MVWEERTARERLSGSPPCFPSCLLVLCTSGNWIWVEEENLKEMPPVHRKDTRWWWRKYQHIVECVLIIYFGGAGAKEGISGMCWRKWWEELVLTILICPREQLQRRNLIEFTEIRSVSSVWNNIFCAQSCSEDGEKGIDHKRQDDHTTCHNFNILTAAAMHFELRLFQIKDHKEHGYHKIIFKNSLI